MKNRLKQGLAVTLCASLILSTGHFAAVGASLAPASELTPPASLGNLTDSSNVHPGAPLVILIQDLHARYRVQKNIAGILNFLSSRLSSPAPSSGGSSPVPFALAVEGASGPIDSSVMALFPDPKIKQGAADYLMREGELSGAEYFAVMRSAPNLLVGVEDATYYNLHRDLFRKTLEKRTRLVEMLRGIQTDILGLRRVVYSKPLKRFQAKANAFEKGTLGLQAYLDYLTSEAEAMGIQIPRPNLSNTTELTHAWETAETFGFMLKLQKATTQREKDLVQVEHDLDFLIKVSDLQATEKDIRSFGPRINQFIPLCRSLLESNGVHTFDEASIRELISSSIDYYALALARNKPMIDNTLKLMNQHPVAVLVAGGFHTAPITQLLRERHISYAVITPNVDKSTDADQALYVKRLNGDLLSTDEIFSSISKSEQSKLAKLFSRDHSTLAVGLIGTGIAAAGGALGYHFLSAGLAQDVLSQHHTVQHFLGLVTQAHYVGQAHDIATRWIASTPDVLAQYQSAAPAVVGMAVGFPFFGFGKKLKDVVRQIKQGESKTDPIEKLVTHLEDILGVLRAGGSVDGRVLTNDAAYWLDIFDGDQSAAQTAVEALFGAVDRTQEEDLHGGIRSPADYIPLFAGVIRRLRGANAKPEPQQATDINLVLDHIDGIIGSMELYNEGQVIRNPGFGSFFEIYGNGFGLKLLSKWPEQYRPWNQIINQAMSELESYEAPSADPIKNLTYNLERFKRIFARLAGQPLPAESMSSVILKDRKVIEALGLLRLTPETVTWDQILKIARQRIRETHPDTGRRDDAARARYEEAYRVLRAHKIFFENRTPVSPTGRVSGQTMGSRFGTFST